MISRRRSLPALAAAAVTGFGGDSRRRIRTAMIGTGHGHANSKAAVLATLSEYEFVGIVRVDADDPFVGPALEKARVLTLEQALDDPAVELVACEFADPDRNLEFAERAVARGKFVHLDKPPGSSLPRFRKLLADAAAKHVIVQMGYQWRYHAAMQAAIEAARRGDLGSIHRFRASIDKPIGAEERRHLARYKGGMMFSEGCHLIDRATALLGKPLRVSGFIRHHGALDDGLADNNLVILEYRNAFAEISLAGFDPHGNDHRLLEIIGSNGSARVQPYTGLHLTIELKQASGPYRAGLQTVALNGDPPVYAADFIELASVIRNGAQPLYSASHDLMTHEVLLEACGMLNPSDKKRGDKNS